MDEERKSQLKAEYQAINRYLEVSAESEPEFRNESLINMLLDRKQVLENEGLVGTTGV